MTRILSADEKLEVPGSDSSGNPLPAHERTVYDIEDMTLTPPPRRDPWHHRLRHSLDDVPAEVKWGALGFTGLILAITFVWFIWFRTTPVQLEVVEANWQRRIEVIEYQPRQRSNWYSHPGDAYNVTPAWEIHHWESYISGYTTTVSCTGSGSTYRCSSTRTAIYSSRPVYATKYYFTVNRWEHARWKVTTGNHEVEPYWHSLRDESFNSADVIGNTQEGIRDDWYEVRVVTLDEDRKIHAKKTGLDTWRLLKPGDRLVGHGSISGLRSIEWPEPVGDFTPTGSMG